MEDIIFFYGTASFSRDGCGSTLPPAEAPDEVTPAEKSIAGSLRFPLL